MVVWRMGCEGGECCGGVEGWVVRVVVVWRAVL